MQTVKALRLDNHDTCKYLFEFVIMLVSVTYVISSYNLIHIPRKPICIGCLKPTQALLHGKQSQTTNRIFITAHSDDCVYFAILFNINIYESTQSKTSIPSINE